MLETTMKAHKVCLAQLPKLIGDSKITDSKVGKILTKIVKTGEELCLVDCGFKCQKCGSYDNLQFHHLIGRRTRTILPFVKYLMQRHFYGNIVILCLKCHSGVHHRAEGDSPTLSNNKIIKIKTKYNIQ